jgi:hypothetical protein
VLAERRVDALEHATKGGAGPGGDCDATGAFFLEVVRQGHGGEEHGLRGDGAARRDDRCQLLIDDGREALQLLLAGGGHDPVGLTAHP